MKQAIDHIIAEFPKEKYYEIKHKDFCTEEFNQNQLQTVENRRVKFDLSGKIEDLEILCSASDMWRILGHGATDGGLVVGTLIMLKLGLQTVSF